MREFMDFEEKSVDKAVDKACNELNIPKDRLKYDIISHGSSGIFGLVGMKKAVIRVTVPESQLSKTASDSEAADAATEPANETASAVSALVDEAFGTVAAHDADAEDEKTETAPPAKDASPQPPPPSKPVLDPDQRTELIDWVNGFIGKITALISPASTVSVRDTEDGLRFDINEGDCARLIGKRGQTLDAIQYLLEKAVYKQFGSEVAIEVDVEGYLDKRRSELTSLASRLAQKAKQTGKPMVINRISAQDRRVVHLSLKDNHHVRTQSVGNGDLRKLLILPKKKPQGKGASKSSKAG